MSPCPVRRVQPLSLIQVRTYGLPRKIFALLLNSLHRHSDEGIITSRPVVRDKVSGFGITYHLVYPAVRLGFHIRSENDFWNRRVLSSEIVDRDGHHLAFVIVDLRRLLLGEHVEVLSITFVLCVSYFLAT